jgi:hypothetical protein
MDWLGAGRQAGPGQPGWGRASACCTPAPPAAHFDNKGAQQDIVQQGSNVWVHLAQGAGFGCLRGSGQKDCRHRYRQCGQACLRGACHF